jgi:hypothetical protein
MIHGRHRGEGLEIAGRLAESIQPDDWQALFSTREYGKSAPDYARLLQARANRTRKGGASG